MAGHESSRQHRRGTCSCPRIGALDVSRLARAGMVVRREQDKAVTRRLRRQLARRAGGV